MKRNVRINPRVFVSLALAGGMIMSQVPQVNMTKTVYGADGVIVNEQFDTIKTGEKPTDGYTFSEETGSAKVVEVPNATDKSLYLEDSGDKNTKVVKEFDAQTGIVTVVVDFMQESVGSTTKVVRLMDSNDNVAVQVETRSGSVIAYKLVGDTYVEMLPYEKDTWYTIQVAADVANQKADIFVNGKMLAEDIPFYQKAESISKIDSFTPGSSPKGHYLDNLQIYSKEVVPVVSDKAKPQKETKPAEKPAEVITVTPEIPVVTPVTPVAPITPETKPAVKPSGKVVYEAEDAVLNGVIIDTKHAGYTGTGFTDYSPNKPGGTLEWKINAPEDGQYKLTFRYGHGGSDARPSEIKVNGVVVEEALAFDPTGEWNNWKTTSTTVTLKAGENTLVATGVGASGGANIDNVTVEPTGQIVLEAEDAVLKDVIIDTKHAGYSGTGFTDYSPNKPGGTIEWKVNVPADSQYKLTFRYGHGGSDARPSEIKVNGVVVEEALAFDPTGEWSNWQTTSTTATLKAGENIILATGVGASGGANIDNLILEPVFDVTYEAEDAVFEGVITDTKHAGYTGTAFTDYSPNKPGGFIEWTVEVPTDADYALQFRYGHGGSDARPAEIKVNGVVTDEALAFDPTGEWNNWTITSTVVPLKAGKNTIRATAVGASGGGNIDNLRVTSLNLLDSASDDKIVMKQVEVTDIINPIVLDKLNASGLLVTKEVEGKATDGESVNITSVDVVDSKTVLVTLDSYFDKYSLYDIMINAPTSTWEALNPNFKALKIDQMAVGQNKDGNTVLVYQLTDTLNENGGITVEEPNQAFKGDVAKATEKAKNMISMQLPVGGWYKNADSVYDKAWDGKAKRSEWFGPKGEELATIDNDATISEIRYIAEVYGANPLPEFKASVQEGIDFLFRLQYESGGFAQVYPRRGTEASPSYSDFVTFNDNAMINVLNLYDDILEKNYPFDKLELDATYYDKIEQSKLEAIDYILNAQIDANGTLTAWCAQHDPYTYAPQYARAYEHPSISGMESAGIIKYLMSVEQTEEVKKAVDAGLKWYDDAKVEDMRYASGDTDNIYFYESKGNDMWYRFYEIGTNEPIFSGRDGVITHNLLDVEEERRNGYSWAGDYASSLLNVASTVGFYEDKLFAEVVDNKSVDSNTNTLTVGQLEESEYVVPTLAKVPTVLTVAKDGSKQFTTVQSAIDAVPENNVYPVVINISDGVYKEVVNIPANKPYISLVGESEEGTIITYDNYAGKDNGRGGTLGTSGSASVYIYGNDFSAKNITFENSFDESAYEGSGTQAVAVYVKGERQSFDNCSFLGNQDTLYVNDGTQYFNDCYIEGDVDFIFGASTAYFENCVIRSLDKGSDTNNGYITAASTSKDDEFGFVFRNCTLTSDAKEGTVYLGRPWHPSGDVNAIASVAFINCEIGNHINADGWTSMSGFEPEGHRFFEYQNTGEGAIEHKRGRELSEFTVGLYTPKYMFDGWNPTGVTK